MYLPFVWLCWFVVMCCSSDDIIITRYRYIAIPELYPKITRYRFAFCRIYITISLLLTIIGKYDIVLLTNTTLLTCRGIIYMEEKKKASEAHMRATAKWEKENYDKVLVRFPKGTKEKIAQTGSSLNGFIVSAVNEKLERKN